MSVARYSANGTAVMRQGVFISDILKGIGSERPGIQTERGDGHSTPISEENIEEIEPTGCSSAPCLRPARTPHSSTEPAENAPASS
ncbi:hypothetical protein ACWCXB_08845 [Streptomyces sp. NPDC001514]